MIDVGKFLSKRLYPALAEVVDEIVFGHDVDGSGEAELLAREAGSLPRRGRTPGGPAHQRSDVDEVTAPSVS